MLAAELEGSKLARLVVVSNRVSVPSGDGAKRAGGLGAQEGFLHEVVRAVSDVGGSRHRLLDLSAARRPCSGLSRAPLHDST